MRITTRMKRLWITILSSTIIITSTHPLIPIKAYANEVSANNTFESGSEGVVNNTEDSEENKNNILSVTNPKEVITVKNGTTKEDIALILPQKVNITTSLLGEQEVDIKWELTDTDYDANVKAEQTFEVHGEVQLPQDIENINNIPLTARVKVVSEAAEGFQFSFMSISDTHVTTDSTITSSTFQKNNLISALQDANNFKCSAISVVGDITDYGYDSEYTNMKAIMNDNTKIPAYFVMGNHDVRYKNFTTAINRFNNGTGMETSTSKPYYDKWVNGYHFLYLSTESTNKDNAYISDNQIAWIANKLKDDANLGKPIFLFLHQPISQTLTQKQINNISISDEVQDRKLIEVLGKYPQSILISGHIHNEITVGGVLYNAKGCTMIKDGCAGKGAKNNGEKPEGLILDIYNNRVVINGRDFSKKSTIWSTTIHNFTTTNLSADQQPPTMPQDLILLHKTNTTADLEWKDSTDNFTSIFNNVGVAGYEIYNNGKLIGQTFGNNQFRIRNLKPDTSYQFTVKARDVAGNRSESSKILNVKTLVTNDAPTNLALKKPGITASTAASTYAVKQAVDGNNMTKWASTSASGNEWIKVDLGAKFDVSRWIVKHAGGSGEDISKNAKTYQLMGSTNGSTWTTLDTVACNVANITDRSFDRAQVRYVKLYYNTPSNYDEKGSSIANLYELEVYGANIYKNLIALAPITGLPYGSGKTDKELKLPSKMYINTSNGTVSADVVWNVKNSTYQVKATKEQTFSVNGTVILPQGVINPDGKALTTSVSVTVSGEKLSKINLAPTTSKLLLGKSIQTVYKGFLRSGKAANLSPVSIKYLSSNSNIATVNGSGLITAKRAGSTTVNLLATVSGEKIVSNSVKIYVPSNDTSLKGISIDKKALSVFNGKQTKYTVILPSNSKKIPAVQVIAQNKKAKVSVKMPKKLPGTATISVTAEDGKTVKTYQVLFSYDKPTSVILIANKTIAKTGSSIQLNVLGKLKDGTLVDITKANIKYSVSNKNIVKLYNTNLLKAKKRGKATIKAKVTINGKLYNSNSMTMKVN